MKMFSSHDWPDPECIKIFSDVKKAMAPHSRVLVRKSYSDFTSEEKKKRKIAPFRGIYPPTCKPST